MRGGKAKKREKKLLKGNSQGIMMWPVVNTSATLIKEANHCSHLSKDKI